MLYKFSWQESGFFPKQNAFKYLPLSVPQMGDVWASSGKEREATLSHWAHRILCLLLSTESILREAFQLLECTWLTLSYKTRSNREGRKLFPGRGR